jgi:hypothetical protein
MPLYIIITSINRTGHIETVVVATIDFFDFFYNFSYNNNVTQGLLHKGTIYIKKNILTVDGAAYTQRI